MLQAMRDNTKGVIAYFIVGIIIVIFALFGVEALVQGNASRPNTVATVNGKDVTEIDVRRGMEVRKRQLSEMLGGKVDPRFLSDEFLRNPVVDGLIRRRLLESAMEANKLDVANNILDKQIVADKNFQQQGKFDAKYYTQLLSQFGYTPTSYREELKKEYLLNQFQASLLQSSFVTDKEVEELAKLQYEKRSFEYLTLALAKKLSSATASEDEVLAYYDKHKDQFLSDDLVSVDYLELNKDQLAAGLQVSEEDIKSQYEAEVSAAKDKVTRHAAHILVEDKGDNAHEVVLKDIQTRLSKGEDFAALAKQYSADSGSALQGGDVGETTGESFVPEFEAALAKLNVGQVSEPVKTKFGYHVIKLLDQKQAMVDTLAASRVRIEAELKKQQLEELYADKLEAMRDASQNASSLADVATELSAGQPLTVQHRDLLPKEGAMMMFRNKSIVDAIFADNMAAGVSTDVIEIDDNNAIILRLTDRKHPEIKALEMVHAQVEAMVRKEKADAALKTEAEALQARIVGGESLEKIARAEKLELKVMADKNRDETAVDREILQKVFAMPRPAADADIANAEMLTLSSGDAVLIRVTHVQTPVVEMLTPDQLAKAREQLQSTTANHEFVALEAMLQASAKMTRKPAAASN
jgi:peptidyl-prolyl cis-trans isomerase D